MCIKNFNFGSLCIEVVIQVEELQGQSNTYKLLRSVVSINFASLKISHPVGCQ